MPLFPLDNHYRYPADTHTIVDDTPVPLPTTEPGLWYDPMTDNDETQAARWAAEDKIVEQYRAKRVADLQIIRRRCWALGMQRHETAHFSKMYRKQMRTVTQVLAVIERAHVAVECEEEAV